MDQENPAVLALANVPPAVLKALDEDPTLLTKYSRRFHMIGMSYMHQRMRDPNIPIGQRLAWLDHLAKTGGAGANEKASAPGAGFSVNIIMNQTPTQAPTAKAEVVNADVQDVTVKVAAE